MKQIKRDVNFKSKMNKVLTLFTRLIFILIFSTLLTQKAFSLEIIEFGKVIKAKEETETEEEQKQNEWKIINLINARYVKGRDGSYDIILRENEYLLDHNPDLLLHFNNKLYKKIDKNKSKDSNSVNPNDIGNYIVKTEKIRYDKRIKVFGESSGKFAQTSSSLHLRPKTTSFFSRTNHAGSFTIEFWLNPATLSNEEIIIKKYGPVIENGRVTKNSGLICKISKKRLNWQFHHVFHTPDMNKSEYLKDRTALIELKGVKRLRRNQWKHHAISFDALSGKLTYFVNGIEESSIFVTESGQPEDTILTPRFYPQEKSSLIIGQRFYGFIDELMISSISKTSRRKLIRFAQENNDKGYFNIKKYTSHEGEVTSGVEYFTEKGTYEKRLFHLKRVKANVDHKNGSHIILKYRMSQRFFRPEASDQSLSWQTLDTRYPHNLDIKNLKGHYFQWKAILQSGDYGKTTPVLKDISFYFDIDYAPSPPKKLLAYSSEGKVFLKWIGNVEADVNSYRIYYGKETGNYLEGKTPIGIDINNLNNKLKPVYILKDLNINQVYYFVVTAVDKNNHESEPSNEVYIRVQQTR